MYSYLVDVFFNKCCMGQNLIMTDIDNTDLRIFGHSSKLFLQMISIISLYIDTYGTLHKNLCEACKY